MAKMINNDGEVMRNLQSGAVNRSAEQLHATLSSWIRTQLDRTISCDFVASGFTSRYSAEQRLVTSALYRQAKTGPILTQKYS
jgi:hypothetical protein